MDYAELLDDLDNWRTVHPRAAKAIRALLAERDAMLAAAPSPEWIQVSERLPALVDADRDGYLWAYDGTEVHEINYTNVLIWSAWTHWMPKPRVTPPEPPK